MNEDELREAAEKLMGIDPALLGGQDWTSINVTGLQNLTDGSITVDKVPVLQDFENFSFSTKKTPPLDPMDDLLTASLSLHYVIDRISRQELVDRITKIWPDAGGLDLSEFLDKLDKDRDAYWRKVRGEENVAG